MRCLITGASGFIGGVIVSALQNAGHEVVALCRIRDERSDMLKGVELIEGELGDLDLLRQAVAACDAVVHAAGTNETKLSEEILGWIHVAGTENLLRAAQYQHVKKFVYISCADVTLHPEPRVHWNEDTRIAGKPFNAWIRSKLLAEEIVSVSSTENFETTILRPALAWGIGDSQLLSEVCTRYRKKAWPLISKGEHLLATAHVKNIGHAVSCVLNQDGLQGEIFYITDEELSLAHEFAGSLCAALGLPPPKTGTSFKLQIKLAQLRELIGREGPTQEDVLRWAFSTSFDTSKARKQLGYQAVISRDEGMRELQEWAERSGGAKRISVKRQRRPYREIVARQKELAGC